MSRSFLGGLTKLGVKLNLSDEKNSLETQIKKRLSSEERWSRMDESLR